MVLEKYHFKIEHRTGTQHRNADGLSKRANDYEKREQHLKPQLTIAGKWNFLSQVEFDQSPIAPWFDVNRKVISKHPQLPPHLTKMADNPTQAKIRTAR